jgi:hypothetical protein
MKKVSLLVLLAILASTLLMAAIPTTIVRLTIINKSEYDVYMKLEGSSVTQSFYYLTVPSGTRDNPTVKVFTIMADLYTRTTWQCNGAKSTGTLIVNGNLRLTFTPCGERSCGIPGAYLFWNKCATVAAFQEWVALGNDPALFDPLVNGPTYLVETTHRYAGEPRMEKVTYFKYLQYGAPSWINAYLYTGFWNFGCGTWYYRIRTYRLPYGCAWMYQY